MLHPAKLRHLHNLHAELKTRKLAERQLEKWRTDLAAYCEERLGITLWGKLRDACSLIQNNSHVAIKSANGVGKTHLLSAVILWWLECFRPSKALTTGPTWGALQNVLWPRINEHIARAKIFPEAVLNQTGITISPEHYAIAKSVDKPEALMGQHAEYLLQVIEEASGLEQKIADALNGNHTGSNNKQVYIGNPLKASGPFYNNCTSGKYAVLTISAFDHPNVIEGREVIPGAVTRESIEANAKEWCKACAPHAEGAVHLWWLGEAGWYLPDSRFIARVLGEFPKTATDALIALEDLEKAKQRRIQQDGQGLERTVRAIGCDVARFGEDSTVLSFTSETGIERFEKFRGKPTNEIAGRLIRAVRDEGIECIAVDDTGVGGGVSDLLREADIDFIPVNFGESADNSDKFANKKAEIYWQFKTDLESEPEFCIANDPELIQEASEIRYSYDNKGRYTIEKKETFKSRVGRSPDTLEAAILARHAIRNTGPSSPPPAYINPPTERQPYGHVRDVLPRRGRRYGSMWDEDSY